MNQQEAEVPEDKPTRTEVAAQALTDYWEPMRGHPQLFTEIELGQAENLIQALDKYDEVNDIIRIQADEDSLMFMAQMLAAMKSPDERWEDISIKRKSLFRFNATIILTTLNTRNPDATRTVKPRGQKQGPPCMSCGWNKNSAPPTRCKDKKSHVKGPQIRVTDWQVQNP